MNKEEEIGELKKEIKSLCMEIYHRTGDEIIELIEKANSVFTSGLLFTDERDTISLCHFLRKRITKDKKRNRGFTMNKR